MSKLIIFDVDGTFLNSQPLGERIVYEYSLANGLPRPDMEKIRHGYGDPHNHDFGWGVSKDDQFRHMVASWEMVDKLTLSGLPEYTPPLYPGVLESLPQLKDSGHTLAIITSKPEQPLLHLLKMHNIGHFFTSHRTSDDIKRRGQREKPHPDMLHDTMKQLNFTPQNTVMIGDTTMDIRMGRSAGAHTIGVTWGAHPKEHLVDAGAHHVVESRFDDLVHTINGVFKL